MSYDNKKKLYQFFEQSGIINALKAEEIGEFFNPRNIDKNQLLLREGQVNNEYLILEEGCMRAYTFDVTGIEITTAFYEAVEPVFEVASYFNRTPSRENIQALTGCKGWSISYEKLNYIFHSIPEFREFGRSILVKGFAGLKVRMLSMITETAEERYVALLAAKPGIFQYAPLKYIASYLGVTDTSLSRIRKERMKKNKSDINPNQVLL
jgi:CRP-like cAMP-binding protein